MTQFQSLLQLERLEEERVEGERQMKILTAMVESGEEKHRATLQSLKEAMERQQQEYFQSLNALEEKVSHCVDV